MKLKIKNPLVLKILAVLFVFILTSLFTFLYLQFWIGSQRLAGNDSYTHLAKATFVSRQGIDSANYKFILPYTLWAQLQSDNTLVFDLLIAPLTLFSNPLIASKVWISIMAGIVALVFYKVLLSKIKSKKISALLALAFTFGNIAFFLKLTELRSLVLSIIFYSLTLLLIFIRKKNFWLLGVISFFFTLLHTTSFLMFFPLIILFILNKKERENYLKYAGFILIGIVLAIIVFPSPNFLIVFFLQPLIPFIYKLAPYAIDGAFEVKGDITTPLYLLVSNGLNILALGLGLTIYIQKKWKLSTEQKATFFVAAIFLVLDLFSRRFSDYLTPSVIVFLSFHYQEILTLLKRIKEYAHKTKKRKIIAITSTIVVLVIGGYLFYDRFIKDNVNQVNYQGEKVSSLPEPFLTAVFMQQRIKLTNAKYTVYNSAWEDFPFFLYYAPKFRYVAGMEPGFMYLYDKDMLRFYQDFRSDKNIEEKDGQLIYTLTGENLLTIFKNKFNSPIILLKKGHNEKMTNLLQDRLTLLSAKKIFEDEHYLLIGIPY